LRCNTPRGLLKEDMKKILIILGTVILATVLGVGGFLYSNRTTVSASMKIVSIQIGINRSYDIPAGTTYSWINAVPVMTDETHYEWINGRPYIIFSATTSAPSYDIANDPSTKGFGMVLASTTYYAKGSAPSNPVGDGDCTFTITNNGDDCDLDMKIGDFTGGVGWNIVAGAPGADEVRLTAYYAGQNPAAGLVLANGDAEFYDHFVAAATLKWDFKFETGTFTDPEPKQGLITITAVVED
jgi:hypothetical protein